jgi:hypothetical protein
MSVAAFALATDKSERSDAADLGPEPDPVGVDSRNEPNSMAETERLAA